MVLGRCFPWLARSRQGQIGPDGAEHAETSLDTTVLILSLAGEQLASIQASTGHSVFELKREVERKCSVPVRQQKLVSQDGRILADGLCSLASLRAPAQIEDGEPPPVAVTLVRVPAPEVNLALASLGARATGHHARDGEVKPLLQHDVAFPDSTWVEERTQSEGGGASKDGSAALPVGKMTGSELAAQLQRQRPGQWNNDCAMSTFLAGDEIEVSLPGRGGSLQAVGFTYSPWDRNYGRRCRVSASSSGKSASFVELGSVQVPSHQERGDPRRNVVKTLFVEVPDQHQDTVFTTVKLTFAGGSGRRLYFVYALGAPA